MDSNRLSRRGTAPKEGLSPQVILGAAAAVVVIAVGLLVFSGPSKYTRGKARVDDDNLPASVYVQRAQKLKRAGNPLGAAEQYSKAAEAAERAGNEDAAVRYNMQAYSLRKHTPINVRR